MDALSLLSPSIPADMPNVPRNLILSAKLSDESPTSRGRRVKDRIVVSLRKVVDRVDCLCLFSVLSRVLLNQVSTATKQSGICL